MPRLSMMALTQIAQKAVNAMRAAALWNKRGDYARIKPAALRAI